MSDVELIRKFNIETKVWRDGDRLFKKMPKYHADNEMYFLGILEHTGYVPRNAIRESLEHVSMEYIVNRKPTDVDEFMSHYERVLDALKKHNVRHGDLTRYSVLARDNKPVLIDFAEARLLDSPIPSKRPEPDSELLLEAMLWRAHNVKQ